MKWLYGDQPLSEPLPPALCLSLTTDVLLEPEQSVQILL